MEPSVSYGSVILVCTGSFRFSAPHVGDIIAFQYPPDPSSIWIKRIIAVGPQKLAIRDGRVVLDGRVLAEPYLNGRRPRTEISTTLPEVLVPAGSLFVMGDNRDNSLDSRQWGFVPVSALVGRVCGGLNG
jgi:signal peptidase I